MDRATDSHGRPVALWNANIGGGFAATYRDDESVCVEVEQSHVVFVDGQGFYANEARFGGIVVQPLAARPGSH